MKIAYLFGTYPRASETFLQREIHALEKAGFEIEIWALRASEPANSVQMSPFLRWKKINYFRPEYYFNSVGRCLASQLGDVDHLHAAWAGHPAQIAMAAARQRKIPWSFSGHARDLWVRPRCLKEKIESAAFVTSCTRQGVAFLKLQNLVHAAKVLFVPHGLPLEQYPFTARQDFYPPLRLLAVGRLEEKKGFEFLLRALKLLQNQGLHFESTILGSGSLRRKLEEMTSELQLTHLRFEGAVPPDQVRAHMQRSSLLVAPCVVGKNGDHDGLPNVLLEAAALGLPILTTPVGGIGDLIDEQTGWLCRPRDGEDLAESIQQVFVNPQSAFNKAQAARLAVEKKYDVAHNIERLASAFHQAAIAL